MPHFELFASIHLLCGCVCGWVCVCVCDFFFFSFSVVYGCSQARGQATATLEAMPSSYAVSHKKSPFLNQ